MRWARRGEPNFVDGSDSTFHTTKGIPVMRNALLSLVSCLAFQATATDLPAGSVWSADARSGAMGRPFWTDSANWNLFTVGGHSAVLPGEGGAPVQVRLGSNGLAAENSDASASQSQPAALQLRGTVEQKAGYVLDLGWINQASEVDGAPSYEAGRFGWGFDVGTAFGPDRAFALGLGIRMRFPSTQTQDTTGSGVVGDYERFQPSIQALRFGMATHFAQSVTLGARMEASADIDTLVHSGSTAGDKTLHRYVLTRWPIVGLSGQFDKADFPVQGLVDVTFGKTHRIGVMKTLRDIDPPNVDFPALEGDSLRVLVGAMGRWTRDGHTIRPVLVFERGSLENQMYAPVVGTKDPFAKGDKLRDSGWTTESEGGTLGAYYAWDRGVSANLELSSVKRNLQFRSGMDRDNESHTDMGISMGVELSHRLIPQWREKVPASMEFLLRMGWERRSFAGYQLENGFLAGMTTGYEAPSTGYIDGWLGQEEEVGIAPDLGTGFDLNLFTFGLGATFLDRALELGTALQVGSLTPNSGDALDVFGWRAELRWSH